MLKKTLFGSARDPLGAPVSSLPDFLPETLRDFYASAKDAANDADVIVAEPDATPETVTPILPKEPPSASGAAGAARTAPSPGARLFGWAPTPQDARVKKPKERQRRPAAPDITPAPSVTPTYERKRDLGLPLTSREKKHLATREEALPPGARFAPFGIEQPVPDWLNAQHPFFTGKMRRVVRCPFKGGGWVEYTLAPRLTLNAATYLFESLAVQALFERWKRGLPVTDAMNRMFVPDLTADGIPIIETKDEDDGAVWAFCALPGEQIPEEADLGRFTESLGRYYYTPYKGMFAQTDIHPKPSNTRKPAQLHNYLIARPDVRRRLLKAGDPDRNPFAPPSTVFGSAQFAWRDELKAQRIIDHNPEVLTGHTFLGRAVREEADGRTRRLDHLASWGGEGHRLIVGPPGSGKFTCAIAPLLLRSADAHSAFVFDVKNGEATMITGPHRATLGPVTVLDPFEITGRESGAINPLDLLRADNPRLVTAAERLTEAIYMAAHKGGEDHWDRAAKKLLAALLMHIGTSPVYADDERTLKTLRAIVRDRLPTEVIMAMKDNPHGDGEIAAEAKGILDAGENSADRYRFYILDALSVNLSFLKIPEILKSTERTTFNVRDLRKKVSTLYIATPDHELPTVNRWVRLVYAFVMEQMRDVKADQAKTHLHVVMDEFPALGKFERVALDMAQTRSLNIHMHIVCQTFQQLLDLYGEGWGRLQGTSAVTHVLGVRDMFTATEISKMLGTTTVKTSNSSESRGTSGGSQSQGSAYAGRALRTPEELLGMRWEEALAVIGGMNPVALLKAPSP